MKYVPYLRNRFLRIAPAFYASIALEVLFFHRDLLFSGALLAHLAFANIVSYKIAFSIQPVYWTLAVEMQFYLFLMPAGAMFKGRKGYAALAAVILLSLVYRYAVSAALGYSSHEGVLLINELPGRLPEFCLGMLAAKLYLGDHQGRIGGTWTRSFCLVAGAALLAGLARSWLAGGDGIFDNVAVSTFFHPLLGLAFVLIMLPLLKSPDLLRRSVLLRPVAFVGIISYSLYLWHMFIVEVMGRYLDLNGEALRGWHGITLALALATAFSAASYFLIEKTFLRFKA
jgi:peptidoglycan/LPS O-acetylase OafA/YrhL